MPVLKDDTTYSMNTRNKSEGLVLMSDIRDKSIAAAFFDPQYRGILDKLKYGNEGVSRGKARSSLPQMDSSEIINFIRQINRVLKDSGHLFLWVDKFHLCQGVLDWFLDTSLHLVDLIV